MRRWAIAVDIAFVFAFVVIGREEHAYASDLSDYVRVASPFLIGLVVSSAALRSWSRPLSVWVGALLGVGTVVIGMLLRKFVWGDGTALAFVLVAFGFIVAGFVAWRLVAAMILRALKRPADEDGSAGGNAVSR